MLYSAAPESQTLEATHAKRRSSCGRRNSSPVARGTSPVARGDLTGGARDLTAVARDFSMAARQALVAAENLSAGIPASPVVSPFFLEVDLILSTLGGRGCAQIVVKRSGQ